MARKSFVWINGDLAEKTGDNTAIMAGENYYKVGGVWSKNPYSTGEAGGVLIMPDIQPYRSTIDGSLIKSRSHHREHLREHGCIEVGNERPKPRQEDWSSLKGLRQELIARINN